MIGIGRQYRLKVVKLGRSSIFLDAKNLGEVNLPRYQAPEKVAVGDSIQVFLYLNSDDQPVATTRTPKGLVGEFAYLSVVALTRVGAFMDWGLEKDVLAPYSEQYKPMKVGSSYLVFLFIGRDGRIKASSKIDQFLDEHHAHGFQPNQPVDLIITNETDMGFKAIVDHRQYGLLYRDEVFQDLTYGQKIRGFVKYVRPDGKLDLSLQCGQETRDKHADTIWKYLKDHGGFAPVHDKSDPQRIVSLLGMSKGAFKKAIGGLYKQKVIVIEDQGIRLVKKK